MHHVIAPGSPIWWMGFIGSAVIIAFPLWLTRNWSESEKVRAGKFLGALFLMTFISLQLYQVISGTWSKEHSLPLQLCAISSMLSGLLFFFRNQTAYEALVYWGIPGAFHSLLTPELVYGYNTYLIAEYYVAHAGIICAALYLGIANGWRIRTGSWLRIWLITQILILLVGGINHLTGANYMYLCQKPLADNPFIIGEWPWYVIGLEIAGLLHFWLVYLLFRRLKLVQPSGE